MKLSLRLQIVRQACAFDFSQLNVTCQASLTSTNESLYTPNFTQFSFCQSEA
jgi:hypothetical protein